MAYKCKCGNDKEFLEVFTTAVNLVDGSGEFIEHSVRDVSHYFCRECDTEIPYGEFFRKIAQGEKN